MYKIPLFILCVLTNSVFPFVTNSFVWGFRSKGPVFFNTTLSEFFYVITFKRNQILRKLERREKRVVILYTSYKKRAFAKTLIKTVLSWISMARNNFFCIKKLNNSQLWVLSQFFFDSVNCIPMRFDLMTEILITILPRWSSVNNFDSLAI